MPKCSGPTALTRGVSWPLGFSTTNAALLPRRDDLDRLIRLSFRFRRVLPFPNRKAAGARGLFSFLFLSTYIPSWRDVPAAVGAACWLPRPARSVRPGAL